jgi:hypothetical protein
MKKVLGILGIAVIAAAMFFTTNNVNESTDSSLSSFVGMNSANAEDGGSGYVRCALVSADLCILTNFGAYQGYRY